MRRRPEPPPTEPGDPPAHPPESPFAEDREGRRLDRHRIIMVREGCPSRFRLVRAGMPYLTVAARAASALALASSALR